MQLSVRIWKRPDLFPEIGNPDGNSLVTLEKCNEPDRQIREAKLDPSL
ncbi:hypothetical protein [Leptospira santarosai]|nr:hypothetical protein [Leptospira santarosai]